MYLTNHVGSGGVRDKDVGPSSQSRIVDASDDVRVSNHQQACVALQQSRTVFELLAPDIVLRQPAAMVELRCRATSCESPQQITPQTGLIHRPVCVT